jgi:Helix-turn-helix domain
MPTLLDPKETGAILNKSQQTLAWWRCSKRYNLPFLKIGGRVMYREDDVLRFLASCRTEGECSERR